MIPDLQDVNDEVRPAVTYLLGSLEQLPSVIDSER